jgi:hypothetical protein
MRGDVANGALPSLPLPDVQMGAGSDDICCGNVDSFGGDFSYRRAAIRRGFGKSSSLRQGVAVPA